MVLVVAVSAVMLVAALGTVAGAAFAFAQDRYRRWAR